MPAKSILLRDHEARSFLDGSRTQIRRPVKPQPVDGDAIIAGNGEWLVGKFRDSENAWRTLRNPYSIGQEIAGKRADQLNRDSQ